MIFRITKLKFIFKNFPRLWYFATPKCAIDKFPTYFAALVGNYCGGCTIVARKL